MKYAIVTGASRGIGKAIAEKFLSQGISVAICARDAATIAAVSADMQNRYPLLKVVGFAVDLTDERSVLQFAAAVLDIFPSIDILVNNAGTYMPGTLADEPDGQLNKMLAVNLFSAYWLTRKILPVMKTVRSGHVFNISSIAGLHAYPNGGSYSVSKYAMQGFSENLRLELQSTGIRVTTICPGAVYTSSWNGSGVAPERIMEATDVADIIWSCYALSPQANIDNIVMRPQQGDL